MDIVYKVEDQIIVTLPGLHVIVVKNYTLYGMSTDEEVVIDFSSSFFIMSFYCWTFVPNF